MTEPPLLTCRELIDFIAEYLDGSLDEATRREFDRHLRVCPSCVNYLDGYRRAIALGKAALAPTEAPANTMVPETLVRAVQAAHRTVRESQRGP